MNSLQLLLLDLVRMAETPVYSAYAWLGERLGRRVAMSEYFGMVRELMGNGLLRLWVVGHESRERVELHDVPPALEERYAALHHADDRYDPFGLSLTLGATAVSDIEAAWEVDLDFRRGEFRLLAMPGADGDALRYVARCFPGVDLIPVETTLEQGKSRVIGRVLEHQ